MGNVWARRHLQTCQVGSLRLPVPPAQAMAVYYPPRMTVGVWVSLEQLEAAAPLHDKRTRAADQGAYRHERLL